MILRGAAHVHSTYSYDGCHPLADVVHFLRERGLDFVLMSEHTRLMTDADVARFVTECEAISDATFLVVPGLEFEAMPDWVHILAYNIRTLVRARLASDIVRGIRAAGGFACLAHPLHGNAFAHVPADTFGLLQGWEVWNGKADGRWFPDARSVQWLGELQASHGHLRPMGGADLHRLESYPGITIHVRCADRSPHGVMAAIENGAYEVVGAAFAFSGGARVRVPPLAAGRVAASAFRRFKRVAQGIDRWMAQRGMHHLSAPFRKVARRVLR